MAGGEDRPLAAPLRSPAPCRRVLARPRPMRLDSCNCLSISDDRNGCCFSCRVNEQQSIVSNRNVVRQLFPKRKNEREPVVALRLKTIHLPMSWSFVVGCWRCEGAATATSSGRRNARYFPRCEVTRLALFDVRRDGAICQKSREQRKWLAHPRNNVNDPKRT